MDQNNLPDSHVQEPVRVDEAGLGVADPSVEPATSGPIDIKNTVHQAVMSAGKPEEKGSSDTPATLDQPETTPPVKTTNAHQNTDYSAVSTQMVQMLDSVPRDIGQFAELVKHYRVHLTKSLEDKEG